MTESLAHVSFGLGWDPAGDTEVSALSSKDIDLNAAALAFVGDSFTDVAYHEQLTSRDGALRHHGDSVTGDGDGENEVISVDLTLLDPAVTTIVFLVTSYSGQRFSQIDNGFCRIVDNVTGIELVRLYLAEVGAYTGIVFGKLHRPDQNWAFTPIGQPIVAQHIADAVPQLTTYLH
ncbi:TerD family protein [Nocardia sp. NPDC058705]|uniref:TerD family protein n=1 Tax=Nocardia sp. NPDC058705 TaxID=3346609 RepID=UPI0036B28B3B